MNETLRVLLVDDDMLDRRAARRALYAGEQSVEIVETTTCADALVCLQGETPPDIVLLDYQLPDGDGLSLIRRIQALELNTPVIMLTGHGDERVAVELMKAGAADYLPKGGLTSESLWRSLRGILRLRRAEAETVQERQARQETQQQNEERLRFLYDTTSTPDLSFEQKMERLLEEGCRQFGAEAGMLAEAKGEHQVVICAFPANGDFPVGSSTVLADTFCWNALQVQDALGIKDATEPQWRDRAAHGIKGFQCYLGAAVRIAGDAWGTLCFFSRQVRAEAFTAGDKEYARLMAQWIGGELVRHRSDYALRRSEERYRSLVDATAQIIWTTSAGGEMVGDQPQWSAFTGQSANEFRDWGWLNAIHPDDQWRTAEVWTTAIAKQIHYEVEHRLRRSDGVYRTMTVRAVPVMEEDGSVREWVGVHTDITERTQAEGRLRAHAEREGLVNRIGQALRASLDTGVILETATREVGQAMNVSRCLWASSTHGDALEIAPQQYTAPGVTALSGTYRHSTYPPDMLAQWQAGRYVAVADVDAEPLGATVPRRIAPDAVPKAFLVCPVLLRGEWIGLFGVHQNSPRLWTEDEVALLTSITDMLSLAIDNARRYAHERHVADRLQAAFLPDIPDELHGLDLAKSYRSGLEEAQVGGDLYDAFALSDDRVALVIADVSGKGLDAAVQTATVKYSLRAFAAEAAAPGLVLRRLNRTLCQDASGLGEHFVTLFYAVYEPLTGRLTYASAGHETQIIKRASGDATLLHANGPILGITEHVYQQESEYLQPGDALILFTDGLTEARAVGTRELLNLEGVTDFVTALSEDNGAGAICASLERLALDWTGGRPQDDLALLVARRSSERANAEAAGSDTSQSAGEVADEFLFGFALPSCSDYTAEVRQAVAHWMVVLGFDRAQTEDFQTAVTEAVTNAVRHGSPQGEADQFRVSGYRRPQEGFAVEVADNGPGLPAGGIITDMPAPEALGGRGLPLIAVLSDEVTVLPAEVGLHLRLVKSRPSGHQK